MTKISVDFSKLPPSKRQKALLEELGYKVPETFEEAKSLISSIAHEHNTRFNEKFYRMWTVEFGLPWDLGDPDWPEEYY